MALSPNQWTPEKAELHRVTVAIHEHEALQRGALELPEGSPVQDFVLHQAARSWIWSYEPTYAAARAALDGYKCRNIIPDVPSLT